MTPEEQLDSKVTRILQANTGPIKKMLQQAAAEAAADLRKSGIAVAEEVKQAANLLRRTTERSVIT